mgnify:CR=1 FL=1|nr:MAG TPA: PPR repeat family [Caudoviricetes sp.]
MIDTSYNEIPKLTWGEMITIGGSAVINAVATEKITLDEAVKVFDVLTAAFNIMRNDEKAKEVLNLMQEHGMDYNSAMSSALIKKMG